MSSTAGKWLTRSLLMTAFAVVVGVGPGNAGKARADVACPWMDTTKTPDQRANALLAASTLDQKLRWLDEQAANNPTQLTFSGGFPPGPPATYASAQLPCTPIIQYTDGPWGVNTQGATAFPVPVAQTASWDAALSRAKGKAQGYEAFNLHRNVVLAPGIGIARHPFNGRNAEYMGEDPLLAGVLAGTWIQGLQKDNPTMPVEAVLKHYVGNEQELDRQTSSSNIDARTLHEIYDLPFEVAIHQGDPGGIMCAYNQVNGVYSCENPQILRQYLKNEIGFRGWVVSDFGAVHSTVAWLAGGLDQELNHPVFFSPANLKAALAAGQITESQINDAAFRVVRAHIAAGLFDNPLPAAPATDVSTPENQAVALKMAEEGTVLLKNQRRVLPVHGHGLKIAVIGPTASATPTNGVSAQTVCSSSRGAFGPGGGGAPTPVIPCGAVVPPLDAIAARAAQDGGTVTFDNGSDLTSAAAAARSADIAVVFGYYTEGEGRDRANFNLDNNGDALISAVAAAQHNTIVVLETGSAVLMPWIDQVKAVFEAWYPGVEQGTAIAELLWGDVNPSGRLPVTFPKSVADLPTNTPQQYPGVFADGTTTRPAGSTEIRQVNYTEGLNVGYRWYENEHIKPLFPFGHGLSYSSFSYDDLRVSPDETKADRPIRVRFRLRNTSSVAGTEVAQVYLTLPASTGEPSKRLVGWARVALAPHESRKVEVVVDPSFGGHPLSYWNEASKKWTTASGRYLVSVGSSVREIAERDTIELRSSSPRDHHGDDDHSGDRH